MSVSLSVSARRHFLCNTTLFRAQPAAWRQSVAIMGRFPVRALPIKHEWGTHLLSALEAAIEGIPVVLVIHKANTRIEKKVQQDRDRMKNVTWLDFSH
jgi:hypothetical protein